MKQKKRDHYWPGLIAGLLLVAAGIPARAALTDRPQIALLIIAAGAALIVTSMTGIYLRSQKKEAEDPDERDRKIQRAAFSDSWIVTFWLVLLLTGIYVTGIVELRTTDILTVIFLGMGISAAYFRWKHENRGDVE